MTGEDDFLSYIKQHHREFVTDTYACKIVPGSLVPFTTEHSGGVAFTLVIIDDPYKGREVGVRFCARNDKFKPVVSRDMNILAEWAEGLAVTGGKDLLGLMFKIGAATEAAGGVSLKLNVRTRPGGLADITIAQFMHSNHKDTAQ